MLTERKDVDRRVRRTKRMFRKALIKLLEEKDYKQITVTDIVEYADYNRSTFYLHYKYKDDLADEVVEHILNELIQTFRSSCKKKNSLASKPSPADIILFDYILRNKDFFKLWENSKGIPHFQERFIKTIKMLIKEAVVPFKNHKEVRDQDLFITFHAYGIMGLVIEWIESGFYFLPEHMAAQLIDMIYVRPQEIMQTV